MSKYQNIDAWVSNDAAERLALYLCLGVTPQGCLGAILANDLRETVRLATLDESREIAGMVAWMARYMPPRSWGSVRLVEGWVRYRHSMTGVKRVRDVENVKRMTKVVLYDSVLIEKTLEEIDKAD